MSSPNRSRRILILIALLCLVVVIVYAFQSSSAPIVSNTESKQEEQNQEIIPSENITHLEHPAILPNEKIISHTGYSFVYSEEELRSTTRSSGIKQHCFCSAIKYK